uniref:Coilin n=1 Tax=Lygus hesperus TaxID=30085 RepID=A0A0A9VY90_LYGHE
MKTFGIQVTLFVLLAVAAVLSTGATLNSDGDKDHIGIVGKHTKEDTLPTEQKSPVIEGNQQREKRSGWSGGGGGGYMPGGCPPCSCPCANIGGGWGSSNPKGR